jgi:hypothetical protein
MLLEVITDASNEEVWVPKPASLTGKIIQRVTRRHRILPVFHHVEVEVGRITVCTNPWTVRRRVPVEVYIIDIV